MSYLRTWLQSFWSECVLVVLWWVVLFMAYWCASHGAWDGLAVFAGLWLTLTGWGLYVLGGMREPVWTPVNWQDDARDGADHE